METENNTANWKEGIDTNYTDSIKDFENVGDLVKNYHELRSAPKGLFVPKNDADDDTWHQFYNDLGRPDNKQYLSANEEDRKSLAPYEEILYNSGLSQRQGEKLLNALIGKANEETKSHETNLVKQRETAQQKLKDKYGDNLEASMNLVNAAVSQYGSSELNALLQENTSPVLIDMLVNVGKSLTPDKLITGQSKNTLSTKEAAAKEIQKLQANEKFMKKYNDNSHHHHQGAIKTMKELYEQAYESH